MPKPEVLQVQFSREEADRIRKNAKAMGMTTSGYIRQIVRSKLVVAAWWGKPFDNMPVVSVRSMAKMDREQRPPRFFLELGKELGHGSAEYKVFDENGDPMTQESLASHEWHDDFQYRDLRRGRLILRGDDALWRIVRSVADENLGGQLRWILEVDDRGDNEQFEPTPPFLLQSHVVVGECTHENVKYVVFKGPAPQSPPMRMRSRSTGIEYRVGRMQPQLDGITNLPRNDGSIFGLELFNLTGSSLPVPNDTLDVIQRF